jgi:hypothetical protein
MTTPAPLTPEEYARRLHELRTAVAHAVLAIRRAGDLLAMSAGLAMNAPSKTVILAHRDAVRAEADRVAAMVEG